MSNQGYYNQQPQYPQQAYVEPLLLPPYSTRESSGYIALTVSVPWSLQIIDAGEGQRWIQNTKPTNFSRSGLTIFFSTDMEADTPHRVTSSPTTKAILPRATTKDHHPYVPFSLLPVGGFSHQACRQNIKLEEEEEEEEAEEERWLT